MLVLSVDARRAAGTDSGFEVTTHGGRKSAGLDAIAWAARATELGAGEILLNAMDADGTQDGFDLELIAAVRREVTIPVIASGGAGRVDHFAPAVDAGADAVLAATVFHFGTLRIGEVKAALGAGGPPGPLTRRLPRPQPRQLGRAGARARRISGLQPRRVPQRPGVPLRRGDASTSRSSATSPGCAASTSSATSAPTRSRWRGWAPG